jgi:hypothetical protein
MVFISNPFDVTLTAPSAGPALALQVAQQTNARMSFDQAAAVNNIYQNNGHICQRRMCEALTGCDRAMECPNHPEWQKVVQFCGPVGTPGLSMDGAWWNLQQADERQQLLSATQKTTGMNLLPTAYNVVGMY